MTDVGVVPPGETTHVEAVTALVDSVDRLADRLVFAPDEDRTELATVYENGTAYCLDSGGEVVGVAITYMLEAAVTSPSIGLSVEYPHTRRLPEGLVDNDLTTTHGYLALIAVDPDRQGEGHGTRLLERVLEAYDVVSLHAEASNERARTFYESNGFVLRETVTDYYSDDEDACYFTTPSPPEDCGTVRPGLGSGSGSGD